jgi:hypothetical protein
MAFKIGQTYSRREISNRIGGDYVSYLPMREGNVVCGCFKKIPQYNPEAPEVITIGRGKGKVEEAARTISRQHEPIPIFLFRYDAAWEYIGNYRCIRYETDPGLCQQKMHENPARGLIVGILFFEKV